MNSIRSNLVSVFSLAAAAAIGNGCLGQSAGIGETGPSPGGPADDTSLAPPNTGAFPVAPDAGFFTVDAAAPVPGSSSGRAGRAPRPSFGATVTASAAPPSISGGTLLVTHDGNVTVAADPDRDAVYVVDIAAASVKFAIALRPGDEPGRLAEDGAGRVHVALRSGGALVTIDPIVGSILERRAVCPAPRGVAWDAATDRVWVACATGELVAFPSAGGAAVESFVVERDLRDVIIQNGQIAVTTFRSAEVLRLASDGTILRRDSMPATSSPVLSPSVPPPAPGASATVSPRTCMGTGMPPGACATTRSFAPHVAWRAVAGPSGAIVVTHQEESRSSIPTKTPSAYGASGNVVESQLTTISSDGTVASTQAFSTAVLPVDVALTLDGTMGALACAGNAFVAPNSLSRVQLFVVGLGPLPAPSIASAFSGATQPIAVAFNIANDLIVQTREPATIWVVAQKGVGAVVAIPLSTMSVNDTGHAVFHAQAGGLIACASCHPEGGDDGHVWMLDGVARRTPSLRGTISGTAPYHWAGEEVDLSVLATDVYTSRMSGAQLDPSQMGALKGWVETIPAPPPPSWIDASAALRGQGLFQGRAGCSGCHSGAKFTNNTTVNVGTGGTAIDGDAGGTDTTNFQVPPLIGVGWRMPLMHDGCAATMSDRFGRCATTGHGTTAQLSPQQVSDLGAYLEGL